MFTRQTIICINKIAFVFSYSHKAILRFFLATFGEGEGGGGEGEEGEGEKKKKKKSRSIWEEAREN